MKQTLKIILILTASAALAQEKVSPFTRQGSRWVEEVQGVLTGATRLKVSSTEGIIEVRGGSQQEISYRVRRRTYIGSQELARQAFIRCPMKARISGDQAELILDCPTRRWGHREVGADFYVTVPKALHRAMLETMAGDVLAENIDGEVFARTAGGGIQVDRIGGAVTLETAGGGIKLGQVLGPIKAQTAGGPIDLQSGGGEAVLTTNGGNIVVVQCQAIRAETAGGEIRIQRAGGNIVAGTAGGDVRIGDAAGTVVAQTAGGSIHVDSAHGLVRAETAGGGIRLWKISGPVRAETAAGNISAQVIATHKLWGESSLATTVGDVVVYLPVDLAVTIRATIEAAGARHRILSDFPLVLRQSNDAPGLRELFGEGQVNGGGAPLRIRTTSGNIEIRKVKQ